MSLAACRLPAEGSTVPLGVLLQWAKAKARWLIAGLLWTVAGAALGTLGGSMFGLLCGLLFGVIHADFGRVISLISGGLAAGAAAGGLTAAFAKLIEGDWTQQEQGQLLPLELCRALSNSSAGSRLNPRLSMRKEIHR
jgi:Na+/citrate or Na+/malate symporter